MFLYDNDKLFCKELTNLKDRKSTAKPFPGQQVSVSGNLGLLGCTQLLDVGYHLQGCVLGLQSLLLCLCLLSFLAEWPIKYNCLFSFQRWLNSIKCFSSACWYIILKDFAKYAGISFNLFKNEEEAL